MIFSFGKKKTWLIFYFSLNSNEAMYNPFNELNWCKVAWLDVTWGSHLQHHLLERSCVIGACMFHMGDCVHATCEKNIS